jgi:hydroxyacylglutathione hydrolase
MKGWQIMPGIFKQTAPRVYCVGKGTWGGSEAFSNAADCNIYLLDGGSDLALIDTGSGPEEESVLDNIIAAGFAPKEVTKIFLTHAHCDHSGGAEWLRTVTGARIYSSPDTAKALALPERLLIGGISPFQPFTQGSFEVDKVLVDGENTIVGDIILEAIHTPGHTIDSICYKALIDGEKVFFSGDTLVGNQPRREGEIVRLYKGMLGWLDGYWSAPITTYKETLGKLLILETDKLLPGHGIPNDKTETENAIEVALKNLQRLLDDPDLNIMFALGK